MFLMIVILQVGFKLDDNEGCSVGRNLPQNCLLIIEGDFDEYYEVHGQCSNLLAYQAGLFNGG